MTPIIKIRCDNPYCHNEEYPEDDGRKFKGKYSPPYGWLSIPLATFVGTGPVLKDIAVCSTECLGPAVIQLRLEAAERERGER